MARLALYLLGTPRIELAGTPVEVERRKTFALLAYLALTRQPHSREALAALLWPDAEQSRALGYLRTTLWNLNKSLGNAWFEIERDTIALHPTEDFCLDVTSFQQLSATSDPDNVTLWTQAAELVQGDFMAGFTLPDCPEFEEWLFFERESLRRDYAGVLERLVDCLTHQASYEAAIPFARRWLALDSLHEPAHRALMVLYQATGQHSAALRQYQQCQSILQDQLGIAPEPATTALYEEIQANRNPAPVPRARANPPPAPSPTVATPPKSNLPAQNTPFIGRASELAHISQLLLDPACRLLTVLGPGGIGKTRLAIQAASEVGQNTAIFESICYVPLAPLTSGEYFDLTLADALRIPISDESDLHPQLLAYFREKHMLLVLDNFEHLLEVASSLTDFLTVAPALKVLVTSRERLQLQEEWIFEIEGLRYPSNGNEHDLDTYEAVQLFIQSARRVRADFTPTAEEKSWIAQICQSVEGMPLGIELAAGWVQMLESHEIAQEINRSLDFLSATWRNLPPRHRSLRAVFESSWNRLSPAEQAILCKLSVFSGGFNREAAQMVAGATLPELMALVNKSLVRRNAAQAGHYEMHELLRQFVAEKLEADPTASDQAEIQHSLYFADLLQRLEPMLKGAKQIEALDAIENEFDNLRCAWQSAIHYRNPQAIRGLLAGLFPYYLMRGRLLERKELLNQAIHRLKDQRLSHEEKILLAQIRIIYALTLYSLRRFRDANYHYRKAIPLLHKLEHHEIALYFTAMSQINSWPVNNHEIAAHWADRARAIFEFYHDDWGIALALRTQGDVMHHQMRYDESATLYQQSLERSRRAGDRWGEGMAFWHLGDVAFTLGRYADAESLHQQAIASNELIGNREHASSLLSHLGWLQAIQGHHAEAIATFEQAVLRARQLGNQRALAHGMWGLAAIALAQGKPDEADRLTEESLEIYQTNVQHDSALAWMILNQRVEVALLRGNPDLAQEYVQKAFNIFDSMNDPWGRAHGIYFMGEIALARSDTTTAHRLLLDSIERTRACKSINLQLRHLTGIARWRAQTGDIEGAVELLAFALNHYACRHETKVWGHPLLEELSAELPPEVANAAIKRGQNLELDLLVAEILQDVDNSS